MFVFVIQAYNNFLTEKNKRAYDVQLVPILSESLHEKCRQLRRFCMPPVKLDQFRISRKLRN